MSTRIKPGWFVLAALFVYAVVVTVMLQRTNAEVRELRIAESVAAAAPGSGSAPASERASASERAPASDRAPAPERAPAPAAQAPAGLWFPLPGASLPDSDAYLPGAERPYRNGVSQGFDFYDGEVGVPVPYGAPVIAAADGSLERVDAVYSEMSPETFDGLLVEVAEDGATEEQLDMLRGRQVWLRTVDGMLLRYAHLAATRPGLASGQQVYRGQVLGYVGNSGTDAGVAGVERLARLHFEVWEDDDFFGAGLDAEEIRIRAASLFTGP